MAHFFSFSGWGRSLPQGRFSDNTAVGQNQRVLDPTRGLNWLCNSFCKLQNGESWTFTRFEGSGKIQLSCDTNRFGGFIGIVDRRSSNSTTIIVPEGWHGEGYSQFCSSLLNQQQKLLKGDLGRCLEDFEIMADYYSPNDSISSTFLRRLELFGK